jgi:hypothetical protein
VQPVLAAPIVISLLAAIVAGLLFFLRRAKAALPCVPLALAAGFVTDFAIRTAFLFGKDILWATDTPSAAFVHVFDLLEWVYRDVCGAAPFIARLFGPGYIPGGDLILPEDEQAYSVAAWFHIVVWTCLFATGYFYLARRPTKRSNQAMQRTAGRAAI